MCRFILDLARGFGVNKDEMAWLDRCPVPDPFSVSEALPTYRQSKSCVTCVVGKSALSSLKRRGSSTRAKFKFPKDWKQSLTLFPK